MDPCQSASQIEEIKPLLRGDKLTMNNPLWKIWNFHHTISILIKFLNNSKEDIYLSWITSKLAPARPFLKRNKPPVISFIQAAASNLATIKFAQAHLHGKQNHSTTESRYHPPTGPARRPHHPRLSQPYPRAHSPPEFMQTSLPQGLLTQPRDSTIPSRPRFDHTQQTNQKENLPPVFSSPRLPFILHQSLSQWCLTAKSSTKEVPFQAHTVALNIPLRQSWASILRSFYSPTVTCFLRTKLTFYILVMYAVKPSVLV